MAKEIKDYLHLYADANWAYYNEREKQYVETEEEFFSIYSKLMKYPDSVYWYEPVFYKPILRPLLTMTKKEAKKNGFWSTMHNMIVGVNERHVRYNLYSAKQIIWLLSEGFDIFGLIESGLAIDKNQLNNKK